MTQIFNSPQAKNKLFVLVYIPCFYAVRHRRWNPVVWSQFRRNESRFLTRTRVRPIVVGICHKAGPLIGQAVLYAF